MLEETPIFEIAILKKLFVEAMFFTVVKVVSKVQSTSFKVDRCPPCSRLASFDQTLDFAI